MMPRFQPGDYDDFGNPTPDDPASGPDAPEPSFKRMRPARSSGMALASLICGVMFCIPLVPSLFAVIFGAIGLRETRDGSVTGRGFAAVGMTLGLAGLLLWALLGAITYIGVTGYMSEMGEAEVVAKAFVEEVAEGKLDAAMARAVPGIDRKPIDEASAAMKPWGPLNGLAGSFVMIPGRRQEFRWKYDADATFSRGECEILMELVKDGTTYRIEHFTWKK